MSSIQTEIDTSYLYKKLAEHEEDETVKKIFTEMAAIELSHAHSFAKNNNNKALPTPSWRAKVINFIGRAVGYNYVLGYVMETEKQLSQAIIQTKKRHKIPIKNEDTNHVTILETLLNTQKSISGQDVIRFESRHKSVGGNAIRAAVLGGNDGLLSNFSLVMGVAGATVTGGGVLLTGIAGLLAGALSMALGEWISVKSSQELQEKQMQIEMEELENNPEGEEKELALIYMAKGIPEEQARKMASDIINNTLLAHEVLVREELGINPDDLKGSAWEAAIYSFIFFAIGAIIPVIPYLFLSSTNALFLSIILSAIGLFFIGAGITLFTGKNVWYSGFRQVLFGLIVAAITFATGSLIGVEIRG